MDNDTTAARLLTLADAVSLGTVLSAAQRTAPVARLMDNGDVIYGTARSVGDENGNFASERDDVRDCFLRVTTSMGFEAFWPVADLLPLVRSGEFVVDYTP